MYVEVSSDDNIRLQEAPEYPILLRRYGYLSRFFIQLWLLFFISRTLVMNRDANQSQILNEEDTRNSKKAKE